MEGVAPPVSCVEECHLTSAMQLVWFDLIGGTVDLLYAKTFYGMAEHVSHLSKSRWVRAAIGGVVAGLIARAVHEVIGTGPGWIPARPGPRSRRIPPLDRLGPAHRAHRHDRTLDRRGWFGRGLRTSHGDRRLRRRVPLAAPLAGARLGNGPAPDVIVAMMACIGCIARAPLAGTLMVVETTGTLSLIVPAMLAVRLATLIARRNVDAISRSQLRGRVESPTHRIITGLALLALIPLFDAMARPRCVHDTTHRAT